MVYLGVGVDQCLHAPATRLRTAHFTPLGNTIWTVGFVVGVIGIAPWKIYVKDYLCSVCGAEFGGGKSGNTSESSHYRINDPDFYKWISRWSRWTAALATFSFVYVIGADQLVGDVPSLSAVTDWWAIGFAGVCVALILDLVDIHFVTKRFRNRWLQVHPEERFLDSLRVEPEKLTAGVPAWKQFTRGRDITSVG